jgi:P-type conjugative transfer protein TrbG
MEADLGTTLDWVAVDHFNTAHPHSHIMLRGVDDRGQNLIIAREYISHGIRERAIELATLDLGPRTDQEIEARLRHDIGEERLTAIDRRLVRSMDEDRIVSSAANDPFQQSLRAGRLQKLASLGLAENVGGGNWQLAEDLEETLRRIGERGDIIRTMQRELTARKLERPWIGPSLFGAGEPDPEPVIGRVIMRGLADEHIITSDRRTYHLALASTSATAMVALSWTYPQDALIALKRAEEDRQKAIPVATGISPDQLHFDYAITGDRPVWRPLRAFDDGRQTYVEFPASLAVDEAPPLFLVDAKGQAQLVNYRMQGRFYVVDRLFDVAELRLGLIHQSVVRIERAPLNGRKGKRS